MIIILVINKLAARSLEIQSIPNLKDFNSVDYYNSLRI